MLYKTMGSYISSTTSAVTWVDARQAQLLFLLYKLGIRSACPKHDGTMFVQQDGYCYVYVNGSWNQITSRIELDPT